MASEKAKVKRQKNKSANSKELIKFRAKMRNLMADYIATEGCSCCESLKHPDVKAKIAKTLNVPMYDDKSGYNFELYKSVKI